MLPTLRQLQYLKLLAEHGAFGKAADAARRHPANPVCRHTRSSKSFAPVVDRARSGVILTAVGEAALARAHVILDEAEELVQSRAERRSAPDGTFSPWGHSDHCAFFCLGRCQSCEPSSPALNSHLREDLTQRLILALRAGQLDAALIALPFDMAGLDHAHVSDDELMAALPANHRLSGLSEVSAAASRVKI